LQTLFRFQTDSQPFRPWIYDYASKGTEEKEEENEDIVTYPGSLTNNSGFWIGLLVDWFIPVAPTWSIGHP
jgi:hypothetical protein